MKINRQLLESICNTPDGSLRQKSLFNKLLAHSTDLLKYQVHCYPNGDEILNLTLMALSGLDRKNGKLNAKLLRDFLANLPTKISDQALSDRFRNLVVCLFNRKRVDLFRQDKPHLRLSLDHLINGENSHSFLDFLAQEDISLIEQEEEEIKQALWQYLAKDTDGLLVNSYPHGYPQANLKTILKYRYLSSPQESWKDLSERLNLPQGTLTSHFQRKGKPLLREIATSFLEHSHRSFA
jgi:hypothetical protein